MEKIITDTKNDRAEALFVSFNNHAKHYWEKWERARKYENKEAHYKKYKYYRNLHYRAYQLYRNLELKKKFGEGRLWFEQTAEQWKQWRLDIKKERRLQFESTIQIALYFLSESLRADYGTYTCSRCGSTFYHSPCNIYRGAKKEYECCCGHCANRILMNNGQEAIYY
nr:hypothetical protein [uncultured Draconibacterium sp.]